MKRHEAIEQLKIDLFGEKIELNINYFDKIKTIYSINPKEIEDEIDKVQILYNSLKHASEILHKLESIGFTIKFCEHDNLSQSINIIDHMDRIKIYSNDSYNFDEFDLLLETTTNNLKILEERHEWLNEEVII